MFTNFALAVGLYNIVIDEYKKNAHLINEALNRIKDVYLPNA